MAKTTELQKAPEVEKSMSVRFTESVLKELQTVQDSQPKLTEFQTKIIQNTFVKIDMILKENEVKRAAKRDANSITPFEWKNVNLPKLAQDVAAFSAVGLDPLQKNHVHLVPYINNKTGLYDFTPIIGYRGTELKAKKFALDPPKDTVIELVHENDTFKVTKKDKNNSVESYILEIENPFDRGEIVGGFYYHVYEDATKNVLRILSINDILKRKPDYASAEFWGGSKDEYKNGSKTGNKITVEGWFAEMCYKTLVRAAYDSITIDSEKINAHLARVIQLEESYYYGGEEKQDAKIEMRKEAEKQAAATPLNIDALQQSNTPPDPIEKPSAMQQAAAQKQDEENNGELQF